MYYAKDTGKILIAYLKKNGISQAELSRRTGVAEATLHDIMYGITIPNGATIDAICIGLGLSVSEFYSYSYDLVVKEKDNEIVIAIDVPNEKLRSIVFAYIESLNSFIHNLTDPSI